MGDVMWLGRGYKATGHGHQTHKKQIAYVALTRSDVVLLRRRLSGVTDNSLYPVMFMSYLDVLVPGLKDSWQRT